MKPSKRQDAPQGPESEGGAEEARRQRLEKERQILSPGTEQGTDEESGEKGSERNDSEEE